ncbi:MAG: glycine cleavage system aminomethyltransferase GcvT [Thiohalocapsa sp.]|uniref:glycine cleavage system aminomethyltransferase GcvT n=1 Tax=Thiohalocapsa sp. TaxID=2497641 RepID=UPI0025DC16B5|nr:glycine cleavage system aminomethyltransferase GcvT [Thiohalocapsa sp.]MCG6939860.1 glycine cleavage system aminomethyltransferase GcvT [Thiohalocapsa sp.]
MGFRTPLYDAHVALGAKIVPFGGWDMPLHYGSQLDEHHAVRRDAGVFDVSHMQPVDVIGPAAKPYLQYLLANDVNKLVEPGRALYSCMLNQHAGVVDDLICYYLEPGRYRPVVNAATADKDLAWMQARAAGFDVNITRRDDLAMLAVQGPSARGKAEALLPASIRAAAMALKPFHALAGDGWLVGRTGYTGEDGFEIILPAAEVDALWQGLLDAGVAPCGLGARDTLRLEAGMNLYGQDMDEDTDPLAAGLGWTIAWTPPERNFMGRKALEARREAPDLPRFVGLLLTGRGVLRAHQQVLVGGEPVGEITSGGFSPTLERSIALARVAPGVANSNEVAVDIRGKAVPVRIVKPPFVRNGQPKIDL